MVGAGAAGALAFRLLLGGGDGERAREGGLPV